MISKFSAFLSLLILAMGTSSLWAEQVTVDFTGSVIVPVNGDPFGVGIVPLDSISGTFVYERTTVDIDANVNTGLYPQTITDGFAFLVDGTHLFTSSDYVVEVNAAADEFHIRVNALEVNATPVAFFGPGQTFTLDSAGDAFPDDSLPALFPSIASFGFTEGRYTDVGPDFDSFVFRIDSLTQVFVVVPEPLSLLLGLQASAAIGLVWLRRRKKRTA